MDNHLTHSFQTFNDVTAGSGAHRLAQFPVIIFFLRIIQKFALLHYDKTWRNEKCQSTSGECPSPWLFNPETGECDWEANVRCFTCSNTVPIYSTRVNGTCTGFIRCINGRASQHACQNGLHFNEASGQCDLPQNANCSVEFRCPSNIPPGQMVAFRSQTNCSE